jgi:hypothetical protein
MAYRRRQGITRASTFKEEFHSSLDDPKDSDLQNGFLSPSNSSLSVQAIKNSAARHQPALSFALDPSHPHHQQRSTVFRPQFCFFKSNQFINIFHHLPYHGKSSLTSYIHEFSIFTFLITFFGRI